MNLNQDKEVKQLSTTNVNEIIKKFNLESDKNIKNNNEKKKKMKNYEKKKKSFDKFDVKQELDNKDIQINSKKSSKSDKLVEQDEDTNSKKSLGELNKESELLTVGNHLSIAEEEQSFNTANSLNDEDQNNLKTDQIQESKTNETDSNNNKPIRPFRRNKSVTKLGEIGRSNAVSLNEASLSPNNSEFSPNKSDLSSNEKASTPNELSLSSNESNNKIKCDNILLRVDDYDLSNNIPYTPVRKTKKNMKLSELGRSSAITSIEEEQTYSVQQKVFLNQEQNNLTKENIKILENINGKPYDPIEFLNKNDCYETKQEPNEVNDVTESNKSEIIELNEAKDETELDKSKLNQVESQNLNINHDENHNDNIKKATEDLNLNLDPLVNKNLENDLPKELPIDQTESNSEDKSKIDSPSSIKSASSELDKRRQNTMLRDSSFQSDSSFCSSVDSLLESRKPDPEAILVNLGFGPLDSDNVLAKIPKRFLKPSKVRGIDTEAFLKRQQLVNSIHESSVLGYRGLIGNPDVPPSSIVAKIMERFEENELKRWNLFDSNRPQSAPPYSIDISKFHYN